MKILFHMRSDFNYGGITEDAMHLFDLMADLEEVEELSTLVLGSEITVLKAVKYSRSGVLHTLKQWLPLSIKQKFKAWLSGSGFSLKAGNSTLTRKKRSTELKQVDYEAIREVFEYIEERLDKDRLRAFSHLKATSTPRKLWVHPSMRAIESQDYDCVFIPFFIDPAYFPSNMTCVLRLYDLCFITNPNHFTRQVAKQLKDQLNGAIDNRNVLFLCDSPYARDCLERYAPSTKGRTYILPCQVPYYGEKKQSFDGVKQWMQSNLSERYLTASVKEEIRRCLQSMEGYVLVVGGTHARKNYETLIKGWKQYQKSHPSTALPLIWVGYDYPNYKGSFIKEVKPLINDGKVFHLEKVSRSMLNQLFLHASVYVVASYEEGFSIPPIEANQFGVPVIASDIAVHRWVLGSSAQFFNPNDSTKLSSLLYELTLSKEASTLRKKLIGAGKENAKRFYKEAIEADLQSVIKSIKGVKTKAKGRDFLGV